MDSETIFVAPEAAPEQIFVEPAYQEGNFFPNFVTEVGSHQKFSNFWA